jgi:glucokinase
LQVCELEKGMLEPRLCETSFGAQIWRVIDISRKIYTVLLGFDIGGTKCSVVLGEKISSQNIEIVDKVILSTDRLVYEMIESLFSQAEIMIKKNGTINDKLTGIGISCGGPLNSKSGIILSPPNLPGWDDIPITEMAEKRFGKKATLQNDANACAVAEWKFGAGRGHSNIVFLTFGTGMGAGLILNGNLYSGASDAAGEAGHMRLADIGPVGFGKAGSFEGFCSGSGIAQLAQIKVREILQMGGTTSFCRNTEELSTITAKSVADAAYNGDTVAIDVYETSARYLGKGVSVLIDLLNPELIILGSIYVKAQSLIEPIMSEVIRQEVLPVAYNSCRIVPSELADNIGDIAALTLADS